MPIGVTKKEKDQNSLGSQVKINVDTDMSMPRYKQLGKDKKYKCMSCGNSWDNQKSHFTMTLSPLYQCNNGYIPICNTCRDEYYTKLVQLYSGNEAHAIRHFCHLYDIIFDDYAFAASKQISSDRSRIGHYMAKKNLSQTTNIGYTYVDGLKYDYVHSENNVITSREQTKSEEVSVSATAVDRWGMGFSEIDYKNLEEHYKMLKKNNPNADNNQEIFIKSLANLNNLMIKALLKGDSKEYSTLVEQYAKTFKQAGLKTVEEKDTSMEDSFGFTLGVISQYTPEEFYKDKKLYEDYDAIGEYYDRFVKRPTYNLLSGDDIRDHEFFVPENVDET